jgi:hypothetical protein
MDGLMDGSFFLFCFGPCTCMCVCFVMGLRWRYDQLGRDGMEWDWEGESERGKTVMGKKKKHISSPRFFFTRFAALRVGGQGELSGDVARYLRYLPTCIHSGGFRMRLLSCCRCYLTPLFFPSPLLLLLLSIIVFTKSFETLVLLLVVTWIRASRVAWKRLYRSSF